MTLRSFSDARALSLLLLGAVGCRAEQHSTPRRAPDGGSCVTCGRSDEPACATTSRAVGPCFAPLATYDGGTDLSISVAWSPIDDRLLAGANGELRLLALVGNPPEFRQLDVFREQGGRTAVRWSPDGRFALSASTDVRLFSIDRENGRLVQAAPTYTGQRGDIYAIAWAPGGGEALSVGEDGVARLLGVDGAAGTLDELSSFSVGGGKLYEAAFSPDGALAALASENGTLTILALGDDRRSLREVTRRTGDGWMTAVTWSPLGNELLSGTWLPCNTVELSSVSNDGRSLSPTSVFLEHSSGIRVLAFDRTGELALTAGHDDTLHAFAVPNGGGTLVHLASFGENTLGVHDASFSPDDGRLLVAASHADRLTLLDVSGCHR